MRKETLLELAVEASGVPISESSVEALTRLLGNIRRGLQGFDGVIRPATEPANVFRAADPAMLPGRSHGESAGRAEEGRA